MRRAPAVVTLLAALAASAPAGANGRLPAAVDVEFRPGDDQFILFPVTFGLLISTDDGATFHWVCENAVGYTGTFDPDYAVRADGSIWATTFEGLRVSRDGGCTWDSVGGPIAGLWVGEVEIAPDGRVWAATSSGEETVTNDAYFSDDGVDFAPSGLNHAKAWWRTLKVAASDANRIYVSGYVPPQPDGNGGETPPEAIFYRSIDGGDTWQQLPLTDITFGEIPSLMIDGVSPTDPDVVFARAVTATAGLGDVLYRSTDGGLNWTQVLAVDDIIDTVYAAGDGRVMAGVDTLLNDLGGMYFSDDGGDAFTHRMQPKTACLNRRGDGDFFSCGSNFEPDLFALGRSTDATTWTPVVRFSEVAGPLSCPPGTIQFDICESQQWPTLCQRIGACPSGPDAAPGAPDAGEDEEDPKGCCGAAGGGDLLLALAILPFLRRRRRPA